MFQREEERLVDSERLCKKLHDCVLNLRIQVRKFIFPRHRLTGDGTDPQKHCTDFQGDSALDFYGGVATRVPPAKRKLLEHIACSISTHPLLSLLSVTTSCEVLTVGRYKEES